MRTLAMLCLALPVLAGEAEMAARAQTMLIDMVRLAAVNPPGGETRVARYLAGVARRHGIECEVLGGDPERLNFVARLRGDGSRRPLLLMAHSDVVPADATQWTVAPFAGEIRDGYIYGRGTQDTLGLLAAEMAVLIELKERGTRLPRDIILLAEADEEAGSTGIRWLIEHAWPKIDAEFALNEGGGALDLPTGERLFQIQTSEKIPARVVLTARGTAGHASLPRADNPVVHLAQAIVKLAAFEQPVRLNTTTRRYLNVLAGLEDYGWLKELLADLDDPAKANAAALQVRERSAQMEAQLRTSVSPTMLGAGQKINIIPNAAEASVDVRRLPGETREEIYARFRRIIGDPAVEVAPAPGQQMPATEPSALTTSLYRAMEEVFRAAHPKPVVLPVMSLGATDGAFLREKGMAVYGVPVFSGKRGESRAHGNDERLAVATLERGTLLLLKIVERVNAK